MGITHASSSATRFGWPRPSRLVTYWLGWDIHVPAEFLEPRLEHIRTKVLGQVARLQARGAVDDAHAAKLDRYVDHLYAPLETRLGNQSGFGTRWLLEWDASGRRHCEAACWQAHLAARRAAEAEQEANAVYRRFVGLERPQPAAPGVEHIDWAQQSLDWRDVALDYGQAVSGSAASTGPDGATAGAPVVAVDTLTSGPAPSPGLYVVPDPVVADPPPEDPADPDHPDQPNHPDHTDHRKALP
jgi:hypothetical protein